MKSIFHFSIILMIMAITSYLVRILLPVNFCYDCISNFYEEIYLNNISFVTQGFISGLAISTYARFTKKSYVSSFIAVLMFTVVWFTLASIGVGVVDYYLLFYKITPFVIGAAAGMFIFNYVAMYLASPDN